MIRVVVIDDHPIARYGVGSILDAAPDVEVVASFTTAPGVSAPLPDGVGVVLLDLYLNGDTPCLPTITELAERVGVLVISASRSPGDVLAALQAGASGFLSKRADAEAVLAAVRAVAGGEFYLSAELADILKADLAAVTGPASAGAARPPKPADVLSAREQEVLSMIARGFTHSQTATRLGVSASTVDTYVSRIRAKLRLGNKAQLALAALEVQLNQRHRGPV